MRRFDFERTDLPGHLLRPMECRAEVLLACLHNVLMDDEGQHLLEVDSVELLVLEQSFLSFRLRTESLVLCDLTQHKYHR